MLPFTDDTIVKDRPWREFKTQVMKPNFDFSDPKVSISLSNTQFQLGLTNEQICKLRELKATQEQQGNNQELQMK